MSEGLLSTLINALVFQGRIKDAELAACHAISEARVRMRTLRPLLQHYAEAGDQERLWALYGIMEHFSIAGRLRIDGQALVGLLCGLRGAPGRQAAVLAHHAACELTVPREALEALVARRPFAAAELLPVSLLAGRGEIGCPLPSPGHAARARAAVERKVGPRTLARLRRALPAAGPRAAPATCLVDGANVGYRGAGQRKRASPAENDQAHAVGSNTQLLAQSNPCAEFFRHDQIAAAVEVLEGMGHVPLIVLPERYAWQISEGLGGDVQRPVGVSEPRCPASDFVREWLAKGQLFIVPDTEPDDLVWIYATLMDLDAEQQSAMLTNPQFLQESALYGEDENSRHTCKGMEEPTALQVQPPRFALSRDTASDHREWIWEARVPRPECVERQRAFHRWRSSRVKWYAMTWADGDHFAEEVSIIVDRSPAFSVEIQHQGSTWYLPDESGGAWLRLQL